MILIEHNLDFLATSDWIVEMRPEEMAEELSLEISQVEKVLKASTGSEGFRSHGKSPDIAK